MSFESLTIRLPKMLDNWPWPRRLNPGYEQLRQDSVNWVKQFNPENLGIKKVFKGGNSEMLRVESDFLTSVIVTDDSGDTESAEEAQAIVDSINEGFNNPHVKMPRDRPVIAELTRQFWLKAMKLSTPSQRPRFLRLYGDFLNAVVIEAADRDDDKIRDFDEYLAVRRNTIAFKAAFWINECSLNLPNYVLNHPSLVSLMDHATDLVIITNDVVSYNKEQAQGSVHNMVAVVMNQYNLSIQDAMDWVGGLFEDIVQKFLKGLEEVPSWGPDIDNRVEQYIEGLGNWVRGHEVWSFESPRYFGNSGLEARRSRTVQLLPPRSVMGRSDGTR
ncbi:terpenoid synthase [Sistotremastrum niveocremeum HHB9708]|uniref:Terpene synthase n=1 Tax=Sistotremastrum niveocremeum HHB9708 TaxID=1314777 RepID=A0A164T7S8_9AGAM|nr:terpenoid synthase [Sistotremastrum niveocremeum HHB9708]